MKSMIVFLALIVNISVVHATIVLNMGHVNTITLLNSSNNFLASEDYLNYWSVWNLSTKSQILSGHLDVSRTWPNVALKNDVFIVPVQGGFNIFHLPNVSPQYVQADSIDSLRLTANGAFIWSGSKTNLRIWNAQGQQVVKLIGNYQQSVVASDSLKLYVTNIGADSLITIALSNFDDRSTVFFLTALLIPGCWKGNNS